MADHASLIEGFATKSKRVEEELRAALDVVGEGKAPSEDAAISLTIAMSELRKSYSAVRSAAQLLNSDIADDQSVYEYKTLFDEYAAKELENQVGEIVNVLERFMRVSSDSLEYIEALKPYQREVEDTLKMLQSPNVATEEKLKVEYGEQDAFLNAITIDELDSPEGESLLDVLEPAYSRKVFRGVYLKKYAVTKELSPSEELADDAEKYSQDEAVINEDATVEYAAMNDGLELIGVANDFVSSGGCEAALASEELAETQTPSADAANHVLVKQEPIETLKSINRIKSNAKVNVSSFKNELVKPPIDAVRYILPILSKCGVLSDDMLVPMVNYFNPKKRDGYEDRINWAIETLQKKSIISAFEVGDSVIAYALTTYGRASLDKSTIRNMKLPGKNGSFWALPLGNHEFAADSEVDAHSLLLVLHKSKMLFVYLRAMAERMNANALAKLLSRIEICEGDYLAPVRWRGRDYVCVLKSTVDGAYEVNGDVLFVPLTDDRPSLEISEADNAFLIDGLTLYKWNHSWVEEDSGELDTNAYLDETDIGKREDVAPSVSQLGPDALEGMDAERNAEVFEVEEASDSVVGPETLESEQGESTDRKSESAEAHGAEASMGVEGTVNLRERFRFLADKADPPSDREFVAIAKQLLADGEYQVDLEDEFSNLAAALALLKSASTIEGNVESKQLLDQLVLATNVKLEPLDNSGSVIARSFPNYTKSNEVLVFAAYCFALFAPHRAYDYDLKNAADTFIESFEDVFPSLAACKPLLNELSGIFEISPEEGFSDNVLDMMGDQVKRNKRLTDMRMQAEGFFDPPKINTKLHGLPEYIASCFGKDSELFYCMQVISSDDRKEIDFVRDILREYCTEDDSIWRIDDSSIDRKIDDEWRAATEGRKSFRKLNHEARKKSIDGFKARLTLMSTWLSYDEGKVNKDTLAKLKEKRKSLSQIVYEVEHAGGLNTAGSGSLVLKWLLKSLGHKLGGSEPITPLFASFLKTGYISLDDDMIPMIDESYNSVRYYEPWRNVFRHLSAQPSSLSETRDLIFDDESSMFDNFRQLRHINDILADGAPEYVITNRHLEEAENAAENRTEKFQDSLEIAYAYSQINEIQKEGLAHLLDSFKAMVFSREDYGSWGQFIAALQRQVDDMSLPQGEELEARLAAHKELLKRGSRSSLLEEAERLLLEEKNYTVVEDYLNRYESGQTELTDELSIKMHDPDLFAEFISDNVFKPLYDVCVRSRGQAFASFAKDYIRSRYPSDWTDRQKSSCEEFVKAWPVSHKRGAGQNLPTLLRRIGINTRGSAEQIKHGKRELYRVVIKPEPADKADYRHPIAAFGTQAKSPLNVLVLHGNHTAQEIIDIVATESIVGMAIVLVNYPISLQVRRQMAEIFHTRKSKLTSFLLIDQVLALHLALHQETERLPLMLKCTLPFTYYQPFVRDGGPTADEMFCGRERELRTIVDPNGASVVYGGRQLGKTALLERAKSLCMKPDEGEYAVYVSILNCESEEEVSQAISDAIRKAGLSVSECRILSDVCKAVDGAIKKKAVSRLLLLIDEADRFLANISDDGYRALQPLVDLKRETKNNFKFVIAGLHNVSRAKNATSRNGIFGQLGEPLCIKPLAPNEALQLISRPLTYLGFQVDRYPHLETILTSTNYYPGILQFFGYTLVETMTKQYGDYYRAADGNPPYTLHKEQLGAIMNRSDLNNSIKEKFRWSLELDPRYFMIARCIALMYYEREGDPAADGMQRGFSADEIKEWADGLGINCLKEETLQSYVALLDEMRDMGILVRPVDEVARFRFRRNSFLSIIGANEDYVLEDIDANNI